MRKKIIRAFLGVYLTICVTYGVVRGVTSPAVAEKVEVLSEPLPQTTTEVIPTPEPVLELPPEPTETPVPESQAETPITSSTANPPGTGSDWIIRSTTIRLGMLT